MAEREFKVKFSTVLLVLGKLRELVYNLTIQ